MRFVLDASVTLTWLLRDANERDATYAFAVLKLLRAVDADVTVPVIWSLEIANVIARAEARALVTPAQSGAFLEMLSVAAITVDPTTQNYALTDTLQLARRYRLSAYDASYLELALRIAAPLATVDAGLLRAASKAGVKRTSPN